MEPLYFGCKDKNYGHYAYKAGSNYPVSRREGGNAEFLLSNDGRLAPKALTQGQAILHHYPEFSVVAYWDYKGDSRPGSNSMVLLPGRVTPEEAISQIKSYFPEIWARLPVTIVDEKEH